MPLATILILWGKDAAKSAYVKKTKAEPPPEGIESRKELKHKLKEADDHVDPERVEAIAREDAEAERAKSEEKARVKMAAEEMSMAGALGQCPPQLDVAMAKLANSSKNEVGGGGRERGGMRGRGEGRREGSAGEAGRERGDGGRLKTTEHSWEVERRGYKWREVSL